MTTRTVLGLSIILAAGQTVFAAPQLSGAVGPQNLGLLAKSISPVATNGISALSDSSKPVNSDNITDKDLLFLLESRLQSKQDKSILTLEFTRLVPAWKPLSPSEGMIDIRILDRPTSGLTSQFGVRFEVMRGDKSLGIYFANLKAHLYRNVWIATSTLKRGATLDQAALQEESRDVISFRDPTFSPQTPELRLTENIPAGAILLDRHVQARPVMFRGDHVQAVIQDDVISVSLMVEVLDEGAPGQFVKARNLRTKKEIQGRVLDGNTILVSSRGK